MKLRLLLLFLLPFLDIKAQESHGWETYLNQVMTAEDAASEGWQQTYDLLSDLVQHPINIIPPRATSWKLSLFCRHNR